MVTNPKPRERPESRSITTLASSTGPCSEKALRSPSSFVSQLSPPTNSLFDISFSSVGSPVGHTRLPFFSLVRTRLLCRRLASSCSRLGSLHERAPTAFVRAIAPSYLRNLAAASARPVNRLTSTAEARGKGSGGQRSRPQRFWGAPGGRRTPQPPGACRPSPRPQGLPHRPAVAVPVTHGSPHSGSQKRARIVLTPCPGKRSWSLRLGPRPPHPSSTPSPNRACRTCIPT